MQAFHNLQRRYIFSYLFILWFAHFETQGKKHRKMHIKYTHSSILFPKSNTILGIHIRLRKWYRLYYYNGYCHLPAEAFTYSIYIAVFLRQV